MDLTEAILIAAADLPSSIEIKRAFKEAADNMGGTIIRVDNNYVQVDGGLITEIGNKIASFKDDDRDITRSFFGSHTNIFPLTKTDGMKMSSHAPRFAYESRDWPVKAIYPGMTVILGDMFSGKTYHIVNVLDVDVIVRFGEPYEDADEDSRSLPSGSVMEALSNAIIVSLLGRRVAIDSMRYLMYGLSGPASEGGIITSFFDVITVLNNMFANFGSQIVVAINPMLADPSKITRLFERVAACVAGSILIENQNVTSDTYRTAQGRVRNTFGKASAYTDDTPVPTSEFLNMGRLDQVGIRDRVGTDFGHSSIDDDDINESRQTPIFSL